MNLFCGPLGIVMKKEERVTFLLHFMGQLIPNNGILLTNALLQNKKRKKILHSQQYYKYSCPTTTMMIGRSKNHFAARSDKKSRISLCINLGHRICLLFKP